MSLLEKDDSYGYELNTSIQKISNDKFVLTEATMYTTLKRLEKNEFIISYWRDGTNTKRKYYSITKKGKDYLKSHKENWEITKKILDKFMEE